MRDSNLISEQKPVLLNLKPGLTNTPGVNAFGTGLTDLVGTPDFNQSLGLERAEAVGKYLVEKGIPAARILKESMGESKAYENYITKEERAKNRKTEVSIKLQ